MAFDDYPIKTDPDLMLADFIAELRSYWPNWEPAEGSLLYRGAAGLTRMIAEGRDVAALVPGEVFRTAGTSLFNIPPNQGQAARADTTWTMRDSAGYTIPAASLLSINGVLFETTDERIIPPGSSSATPVSIVALDIGAAGSGLGAPGAVITLEEGLEFVTQVTLVAATSGGVDAENQDDYMDRLRDQLSLLSPIPIRAQDLARLARTIPGVERAAALDLYDASTATPNVPGHATVAVIDALGGAVPALTKADVTSLLTGDGTRLLNAVIHVVDPTWTNVDLTVDAIAFPGAVLADVDAMATAALAAFLDPANWGLPQSGETKDWANKPVVSLYDVAGALDRVEGLDRVTNIQIGLAGGAQTPADHNLPGVIPLPRAGVINVNVVAP